MRVPGSRKINGYYTHNPQGLAYDPGVVHETSLTDWEFQVGLHKLFILLWMVIEQVSDRRD